MIFLKTRGIRQMLFLFFGCLLGVLGVYFSFWDRFVREWGRIL